MSTHTNAILLLTSHFSRTGGSANAKPLTPSEWGRFAFWLNERGHGPADLLGGSVAELLAGWEDSKITIDRITALLGRGHAMALAMEKWSRAGIWVLARSDAAYPRLLKQRLKGMAPAALYGCGNPALLAAAGIAVVGSRDAGEDDLIEARSLGGKIALGGYSVISGGARGVDEAAMLGALEQSGTAVGVMADSLFQAATSWKWRDRLMSGDLTLVSPYYPEAAFSGGNAMGRNKYIYCLSRAAVVVHSGHKGGTWTGAEENIKKVWVRLWVKPTQDDKAANALLVAHGASWLPGPVSDLDAAVLEGGATASVAGSVGLNLAAGLRVAEDTGEFQEVEIGSNQDAPLNETDAARNEAIDSTDLMAEPVQASGNMAGVLPLDSPTTTLVESVEVDTADADRAKSAVDIHSLSFYDLFLSKLESLAPDFTPAALAEAFSLPRKLVDEWLIQAVADDVLVQSSKRPAKYRFKALDLVS